MTIAKAPEKALDQLASATVDLVPIDLMLPKPPSALELVGRAAVVLMSGALDALEEVEPHPHPSLAKPFRGSEFGRGALTDCLETTGWWPRPGRNRRAAVRPAFR